tara:strand:- start:1393 stop:1689 length:297 start_codon:yes stop_codon:yes gene_type:complete
MTWQDILKDDVDTFNKLLKEFKGTQKRLRDVHGVISELINNELVRYSQVYGGFLPKSLVGEVLGITDEYEMTDDKLEKLMKKVAEMMAIYARKDNPML